MTMLQENVFKELDELYEEFGIVNENLDEGVQESEGELNAEWGEDGDDEQGDLIKEKISEYLNDASEDILEGSETERGEDCVYSEENGEASVMCKCKTNCLKQFNAENVQGHILSLSEMDKDQKEMFVMGSLLKIGEQETRKGKRKRVRYRYTFDGKTVCKSVFCYINDIGHSTVKSLLKHLNTNGPVPRIHGNTGKKPHHAVKYEDVSFCVDFMLLFAEINGLPMPAAPRGQDESAPILLPSDMTKVSVHSQYKHACLEAGVRVLGISTFKGIWKQCVPYIKIMTAKDDVCHKCETISYTCLNC